MCKGNINKSNEQVQTDFLRYSITSYRYFRHNIYSSYCFVSAKVNDKDEKWKKRGDHFFHFKNVYALAYIR